MINPIGPGQIGVPRAAGGASQPAMRPAAERSDFTQTLRDQLEQVNRVQTDAEQKVQNLLTGESIVFETRKHWFAPVRDSIIPALMILAALAVKSLAPSGDNVFGTKSQECIR